MKHTPQGIIALPKSQNTANRSLHAQLVRGKSLKGSKQPIVHYGAHCKPYTNLPETQIDKPKQLGAAFPTSSKQLVVNSMPWHPSTFPLGDKLSTNLKGHGVELSRTAKIKLRCNIA